MVHHFDHRYNSVEVNLDNTHNPYVNVPVTVNSIAIRSFTLNTNIGFR